jgi:hypothetical protein
MLAAASGKPSSSGFKNTGSTALRLLRGLRPPKDPQHDHDRLDWKMRASWRHHLMRIKRVLESGGAGAGSTP